jgi:preprotein translocase subunit SecG
MAMLSSFLPELSIESKLADFLPAPATVFNVALAFTFFMTIQRCDIHPLTSVVNAFGDLFSSTTPEEILVQVPQGPTLTVKVSPTPAVEYRYQPESTSNILYAVALCALFVLVGAVIIVLRKRFTANISSPSSPVNPRFDISSARQTPQASDNLNRSSSLVGGIPGHFGSGSSNLAGDVFDKNASGFLEKLKTFLILFFILTAFTHGGHITQKIRSLTVRDDIPFSSDIPTATLEPYFYQASEPVATTVAAHFDDFPATFSGGSILVSEIVETLSFNILYSSAPSSTLPAPHIPPSHLSSVPDEKYDSISLLPLPTITSNPTSAYPIGLSLVVTTPSPTTSSSSKVALGQAFEYFKFFILSFFCILIPILSFLVTVLPAYSDYIQLSKAMSADQREVISIHFLFHELLLIKISAESYHGIHSQRQRGCSD